MKQGTALWNIAARLAGTGLSFVAYVVVARSLRPEDFAVVSVALAWVAAATALGGLSMPLLVVRMVGDYLVTDRPSLARGVIRFASMTSLACTAMLSLAAIGAVLAGAAGPSSRSLPVTICGVALLLPSVVLSVQAGLLQAFKHVVRAELINNVLRSLLLMALLAVLWLPGREPLSSATVLLAYAAVALLLVALCAWLVTGVQRATGVLACAPQYEIKLWSRTAAGFIAVLLASAVNERIDLLVLGWVGEPAQVASYAVAQRFGQTIIFAANAIAAAMAPHFVELLPELRAGRHADVAALLRRTARLTLLIALGALLLFAAAGPWLLRLFGTHYAGAYEPLLILAAGQAVAALFGPAVMVATLAGAPRIATSCLLTGIVVNAVVNVSLSSTLGATGAALATALASIATAGIAAICVQRRFDFGTGALAWPGRTISSPDPLAVLPAATGQEPR